MNNMQLLEALGKRFYAGTVNGCVVIVDEATWEQHRQLCRAEIEAHSEQDMTPEQAVDAPEYWGWCANDAVEGVCWLDQSMDDHIQIHAGGGVLIQE